MLKNYIKTALRSFARNRLSFTISLLSLSLGMSIAIIVTLYTIHEFSYDRFHTNTDRIYRILTERVRPNGTKYIYSGMQTRQSDIVLSDVPEIEIGSRVAYLYGIVSSEKNKDKHTVLFTDPDFFRIFTFNILSGDPDLILDTPESAFITESFAAAHFPEGDALGKTIEYDNTAVFTVRGIIDDPPSNTDFRYDLILPFRSLRQILGDNLFERGNFGAETYLLLKNGALPESIPPKIHDIYVSIYGEKRASGNKYMLQQLKDKHLFSDSSMYGANSPSKIYFLILIAVVILITACINYINLATASALRRASDIGIRKVVGANRIQLIVQYLGETVITSVLSLIMAIFFAIVMMPVFNRLIRADLNIDSISAVPAFAALLVITLITGITAGLVPAFLLAKIQPISMLRKTAYSESAMGKIVRKGLIITQVVLALGFISGTLIILNQLQFFYDKDLGFNTENIISVSIIDDITVGNQFKTIKQELLSHPDIIDVTSSTILPGTYGGYPMKLRPEGFGEDENVLLTQWMISDNFFNFYGIEFLQGRNFSEQIASDSTDAIILNQAAVKAIGWDDPIGKTIFLEHRRVRYGKSGNASGAEGVRRHVPVIGVIKDYHLGKLHEDIKPAMYTFRPDMYRYFTVKINPQTSQQVLVFLEKTMASFAPHILFDYDFNDELIQSQYVEEQNLRKTTTYAAIIAILLTSFGLFGFTYYSTERRIREIGIRKVFGAEIANILGLFSKEFLIMIIVSAAVAFPVTWYIMEQWLQNFAYRISISPWEFAVTTLMIISVIALTVSYKVIKTALINPAVTLRQE